MLRPFPKAGPLDVVAEDDVDWLQQVIQAVRRIRSELNLPPARMLSVLFQGGTGKDRSRQSQFDGVLTQLARVESMQWVDDSMDTAQCAVALVGDLKILIPLKGLVDVDEELFRLSKQLEREAGDLKKSRGKLKNSRFVENAPEAVVEQERQRLSAHTANVENLEAQIKQLESLRD
jgi:valyl-tRNA synthetase